jgi:predicted ribosomally synthesized peptide with nif11-like leader
MKEDAGLQEKLKGAADLHAAVAIAKEAGFDVSKRIGSGIRRNRPWS